MMNQAERRAFVAKHRTCIFGFQRKQGPPSMSVVYYVLEGDDILISTMAERAKALIGIAHPDFREGLERQAFEARLSPRGFTF